jgi:hypothetical protein
MNLKTAIETAQEKQIICWNKHKHHYEVFDVNADLPTYTTLDFVMVSTQQLPWAVNPEAVAALYDLLHS